MLATVSQAASQLEEWMREVNRKERQSLRGMKRGAEGIDRDGGAL